MHLHALKVFEIMELLFTFLGFEVFQTQLVDLTAGKGLAVSLVLNVEHRDGSTEVPGEYPDERSGP